MKQIFRPAARLVILNENNEVLLARHKRYWALPGGGIDFWEPISDALCRESVEELNIKAELDQIIFIQDYSEERAWKNLHCLEYFCTIKNNSDFENVKEEYKKASHAFELEELEWFGVDKMPEKFMPLAFPQVLKQYLESRDNFKTQYISTL